ncbi:MAG: hypothetical protein ACM30E_03525, partial [Nitrososphaerales archaeon]
GEDYGEEIAVDTVQGAYVVGTTSSTETTFPVTTGTCNAARNGSKDVFVARLHMASSASNKVTYAACLGAANDDWGLGVATDTGGHAFVTGSSASPVDSRMVDAFVAKLKVSSPPLAPTFLPIVTAGADAGLNWTEVDMAATYQLFRSESPYYKPGDWSSLLPIADVTSNSYLDTGALTQVDARYYVAKAVDTTPAASANSNRVGKFTFRLVKGTP